uniref:DOMON domain-containing protein n=1 Tax=Timema douglasi TaxID=61478 RepID=A0A7R8ZDY1_TIMDO|nr:unnamed protein product [Timema douglasi]
MLVESYAVTVHSTGPVSSLAEASPQQGGIFWPDIDKDMFPLHLFLVLPVLAHIASSDHPQLQQVNNVAVLDLLDQYVLHVEEQSNLLDQHKEWEVDSTSRRRRDVSTSLGTSSDVSTSLGISSDVSTSLGTSSDAEWTHSECLEEEDCRIKLSWRLEGNQDLVMLLEAATRGAVGLGWSPGGGMVGADMVLCWVDDLTGKPSLLTHHHLSYSRHTTTCLGADTPPPVLEQTLHHLSLSRHTTTCLGADTPPPVLHSTTCLGADTPPPVLEQTLHHLSYSRHSTTCLVADTPPPVL